MKPHPYESGYLAALSGAHWLTNPWHPWFDPKQRTAWAAGYYDALEDRKPRPERRLQAQLEVR